MQMPQEAEHADGFLDHVSHEFYEHMEVFCSQYKCDTSNLYQTVWSEPVAPPPPWATIHSLSAAWRCRWPE